MTTRLVLTLALCMPAVFAAEDENGFVTLGPDEVSFEGDPGSPQITVISGDPEQAGFYILRARFLPGVMSAPHTHANDRHVTVIKGTWWTGTDASFDRDKTVPLEPGSYMMHPAGAVHYDGAKDEEVIVEIKGIGPAPTTPYTR